MVTVTKKGKDRRMERGGGGGTWRLRDAGLRTDSGRGMSPVGGGSGSTSGGSNT